MVVGFAFLLKTVSLKPGGKGRNKLQGPLSETSDGNEPVEAHVLNLVHPKRVRSAVGHRQNGWRKYRRPRPRLSHKGPMPF
ncbi:apelin [Podarcis lilfordi]|uniref:Apelin n=1 Tax=Podarcis lilfordi TaxID=74358 RepID=A0AA35LCZ3_9SAUR|nr:apelin [Podarcis lilfordi]